MTRKPKDVFADALRQYRFTNYEIQQIFGQNCYVEGSIAKSGLFYYEDEDGYYHLSETGLDRLRQEFPVLHTLFNSRIEIMGTKKRMFQEVHVYSFFAVAGGLAQYIEHINKNGKGAEYFAIDKFCAQYNRDSLEMQMNRADLAQDWTIRSGLVADGIGGYTNEVCSVEQIKGADIKNLVDGICIVTENKYHPTDGLGEYYRAFQAGELGAERGGGERRR